MHLFGLPKYTIVNIVGKCHQCASFGKENLFFLWITVQEVQRQMVFLADFELFDHSLSHKGQKVHVWNFRSWLKIRGAHCGLFSASGEQPCSTLMHVCSCNHALWRSRAEPHYHTQASIPRE